MTRLEGVGICFEGDQYWKALELASEKMKGDPELVNDRSQTKGECLEICLGGDAEQ